MRDLSTCIYTSIYTDKYGIATYNDEYAVTTYTTLRRTHGVTCILTNKIERHTDIAMVSLTYTDMKYCFRHIGFYRLEITERRTCSIPTYSICIENYMYWLKIKCWLYQSFHLSFVFLIWPQFLKFGQYLCINILSMASKIQRSLEKINLKNVLI